MSMKGNPAIEHKISDASAAGEGREWRQIADDVVVMSFPLRAFGIDFRRNVTLLRLPDGRVMIHSTAPFNQKISPRFDGSVNQPGWWMQHCCTPHLQKKDGRR